MRSPTSPALHPVVHRLHLSSLRLSTSPGLRLPPWQVLRGGLALGLAVMAVAGQAGNPATPAVVPLPPQLSSLPAPTTPAAAPAAPSPSAARRAVPAHVQVLEDDAVRIEESRVRGQTRRIVITSKDERVPGGVRQYEIIAAPGGHDPSATGGPAPAGTAGRRAWSVFSF